MPLAPILMTTYRRLSHTKEAIEALLRNPLASESTLYITSDGPLPQHQEEVFALRRYLEGVRGFARVELLFFERNNRPQIWEARREISRKHGRFIYLEEDCVTAPGFLTYINAGLDHYQDDLSVFSVAGYTPPVTAIRRPSLELFRVPSYNTWGFGIWERCDRMLKPTVSPADYQKILASRPLRRKINTSVGVPFYGMLKGLAEGRLWGANDVMGRLELMQRDMVSIFPSHSFVRNLGFDGSGENCGTGEGFHVDLSEESEVDFPNLPENQSAAVNRGFARFYGGTLRNRMRFRLKLLRGKMNAKAAS